MLTIIVRVKAIRSLAEKQPPDASVVGIVISILSLLIIWWWSDPVAALVMVPIIAREGIQALCGQTCCDHK